MTRGKTGPKPRPKSEHYKIVTFTLPPELHHALMQYVKSAVQNKLAMSKSEAIRELLQIGLESSN